MKRARKPYGISVKDTVTGYVHTHYLPEKFDRPPRKEKCGICNKKAYLTNFLCEGCRLKQNKKDPPR